MSHVCVCVPYDLFTPLIVSDICCNWHFSQGSLMDAEAQPDRKSHCQTAISSKAPSIPSGDPSTFYSTPSNTSLMAAKWVSSCRHTSELYLQNIQLHLHLIIVWSHVIFINLIYSTNNTILHGLYCTKTFYIYMYTWEKLPMKCV